MLTLIRCTPLFAAALLVGCGGGSGGEHPTTEVEATVMYNGVPVEGATITFVNTDHETPITAVGRTDAQGVAKMTTYDEGDGAVKGVHKVSILKTEAAAQEDAADVESEEYDPYAAEAPSAAPKALIPAKYSSPTSGLTIEVGDEPVKHTFELVD